ncbi:MAG: glycosyltransferase family 1 protein [Corynebacterium sp.]|nr:glycosyltransferase family 1 protein [Corynebacterium sp.]
MRIALFTEVFLPKIDGVVTRVARTLDQLKAAGHEVIIVAPRPSIDSYQGFEVVTVPSTALHVYPELKYGWATPAALKRVKEFQPDIVHAVNPVWLAAAGVFFARANHLPLLASFHTNVADYMRTLGLRTVATPVQHLIRYFHNRAAVNLVTSGQMAAKAEAVGLRNVHVWPKAVDTQMYRPDRATAAMREELTGGHPEDPCLIYIGRVSKEKNLALLTEIMPALREKLPTARLAVVGSGPFREELEQLLDPAWTTFTGYKSGEELACAFASADAFVFPSTTETLGLVALESMASGVPVIGANAGGIPYIIHDGIDGYLAEPDLPAHWVTQITAALDNRATVGPAARAEAEKFSWRIATERLVEFYEEAIFLTQG